MPLPLPNPYLPGVPGSGLGDPQEFADNVQQNFDALAINVQSVTEGTSEPWRVVGAAGQPAFQNSWVNYDASHQARFYKDPSGVVRLDGTIKSGSVGGFAAFVLPAGYRPVQEQPFAVPSNGAFGILLVEPTGEVYPFVGSNVAFNLPCSFRAEQ